MSSHRLGVAKEHDEFWVRLQAELRYEPARTLFIDDSVAVLRAARRHGIAHIFAISRPDSTQGRREVGEFRPWTRSSICYDSLLMRGVARSQDSSRYWDRSTPLERATVVFAAVPSVGASRRRLRRFRDVCADAGLSGSCPLVAPCVGADWRGAA